MRFFIFSILLISAASPLHAKEVPLPDYVAIRAGQGNQRLIDTITKQAPITTFSNLKLCLAQSVSNTAITMSGGTDVPFAFNSNNRSQTNVIQGGSIFKYEDPTTSSLIVVGTTDGGTSMIGLLRDVIRFELMAVSGPDGTSLKFSNIEQGTLNTGGATNLGFYPVGTWSGAKPMKVVEKLNLIAAKVSSCLE